MSEQTKPNQVQSQAVKIPSRQQVVEYYSQDFVAKTIADAAKGREAAGVYADGSYDKRPGVIQYHSDVPVLAKKGITSFHISVERWKNAMMLTAENYEEMRTGFDIVIDIDSKLGVEDSRCAAVLITDFLRKYGIRNFGIKFSGRRGFHISLPWIMLPKIIDFKQTAGMYPEVPRIIANFVRHNIKEALMEDILKRYGAKELFERFDVSELDPFFFVEVEKDWGNRHLFRAPMSLNEKTWLVSLPISYSQLRSFTPEMTQISNIKFCVESFFKGEENEAESLMSDALDWHAMQKKIVPKKEFKPVYVKNRIPEEAFPPCIKLMLNGMKDGKKRSLFTLINFLKAMAWEWDEIEQRIFAWNEKNSPKLNRSVLLGQLKWSKQQQRALNPANCEAEMFYKSIGVCKPDDFCKSIKNPMTYSLKRAVFSKKSQDKKADARKENTSKAVGKFKCYSCGKQFMSMKALMKHKDEKH